MLSVSREKCFSIIERYCAWFEWSNQKPMARIDCVRYDIPAAGEYRVAKTILLSLDHFDG